MDTAFNILVIILSTALFVLLVIAIVATIFVMRLVNQLRGIAAKGNEIAEKASEFTDTIVDSARTHSFLKAIGGIVSAVKGFKK